MDATWSPPVSAEPGLRSAGVTPGFADGLLAAVPRLRQYAVRLARDVARAEDLVQETLLRAWEYRASYQPGTRLVAWLRTILRNVFYNNVRRRRFEVEDKDGRMAGLLLIGPGQEDRVELEAVRSALARLPAEQRDALMLIVGEDLTYEKAALRLGCEPGTVKSRVSRARTRLAELTGRPRA